ncbi:MAG: ABC transporter permease [Acidobacteriota bacterium]
MLKNLRAVKRQPVVSLVVIGLFAVGIGANAFTFSLVDSLLFSPVIQDEEQRLVRIYTRLSEDIQWGTLSYPEFRALANQTDVYESVAAEQIVAGSLRSGSESIRTFGLLVSPSYFQTLGQAPALGNSFLGTSLRDHPDDLGSIVISYRLWQNRFGGKPDVLGQTLALNGSPFQIVGVMPADFSGTVIGFDPKFWVTLGNSSSLGLGSEFLESPLARSLLVIGKLASDVDLATAQNSARLLDAGLKQKFPAANASSTLILLPEALGGVHPQYRSTITLVFKILQGVVLLVFLISCANIAALLFAQARKRQTEMAIRTALGSSKSTLLWQLLQEGLVLALAGCLVGTALAVVLTSQVAPLLAALIPDLPVGLDASLSWRPILLAVVLSIAGSLIFTAGPALRAIRADTASLIREDGGIGGRRKSKFLRFLVAGQVCASAVLLAFTLLLVSGLSSARSAEMGFEADSVAAGSVDFEALRLDGESLAARQLQFAERFGQLPEISMVALSSRRPLEIGGQKRHAVPAGSSFDGNSEKHFIDLHKVSPDYFKVLGMKTLSGRTIELQDTHNARSVAVVNRAYSEKFFAGADPIGRQLRTDDGGILEVVGVVSNSGHSGLDSDALQQPRLFVSLSQEPSAVVHVLARGQGLEVSSALRAMRSAVPQLEPSLSAFSVRPLAQQVDTFLVLPRLVAAILGAFGSMALILCNLGLYGTLAYGIAQRAREIGLRKSVGASNLSIYKMIVGEGLVLTSAGLLAGIALALASASSLTQLLYGASPFSISTYLWTAITLLTTTTVACTLSSRSALQIEPSMLLRKA